MIDESLLRPHQIAPTQHLVEALRSYASAVDWSDTGTGKTYVACAVAREMQLPTLVVCPKIATTSWNRAAAHFGEKFSILNYERLRTGNTLFGTWQHPPKKEEDTGPEHFKCECCQCVVIPDNCAPCYTNPAGVHCIGAPTKRKHNYGNFIFHTGVRLVVLDEAHRCGGLHSLNAELLIGAKRQGISHLTLTATPACGPLGLRALGYSLDLHNLRNFYEWARKHGCRRDPHFQGFKWLVSEERQKEVMQAIRERIIPARGVRVRCADIPGFPAREISAEEYDLDEIDELRSLYSDMAMALAVVDEASREDKDPGHVLTKMLRARQRIELLKVPIAQSLAEDYLAQGYSVAIFCNFSQTITELSARLQCPDIIDGSPDGVRYRQDRIDRFQDNTIRKIIVNNEAGGLNISLHDLRGDCPRIGIVFPCFSAVTMRQVFGRLHRDGGKTTCHYRVLFAANSVESGMARALRAKSNNIDSLNDADLFPENFRLRKM